MACAKLAMGQNLGTPSEDPNPTTKIGPKMRGEFTNAPTWDPKTVLTTANSGLTFGCFRWTQGFDAQSIRASGSQKHRVTPGGQNMAVLRLLWSLTHFGLTHRAYSATTIKVYSETLSRCTLRRLSNEQPNGHRSHVTSTARAVTWTKTQDVLAAVSLEKDRLTGLALGKSWPYSLNLTGHGWGVRRGLLGYLHNKCRCKE